MTNACPAPSAPAYQAPALPYAFDALEPHVSANTLQFHYGKHQMTYVANLNRLITGTPWADRVGEPDFLASLLAATKVDDNRPLYNNVNQVWNHDLFWNSMKPNGGGELPSKLKAAVLKKFESVEKFLETFHQTAIGLFGSGWVWLVQEEDGSVAIRTTANADRPRENILLVLDVWEHAYYLDYQNRRADFVTTFLKHLANWSLAESRLEA